MLNAIAPSVLVISKLGSGVSELDPPVMPTRNVPPRFGVVAERRLDDDDEPHAAIRPPAPSARPPLAAFSTKVRRDIRLISVSSLSELSLCLRRVDRTRYLAGPPEGNSAAEAPGSPSGGGKASNGWCGVVVAWVLGGCDLHAYGFSFC